MRAPAGTWTYPSRKGPFTAGWRHCGPSRKARSRARGSAKRRTGSLGRPGVGAAGSAGFGYTRIYANPDDLDHPKRKILGEELNPVEADALRDAARRVLDHGEWIGRSCGTGPREGSVRWLRKYGGRRRWWAHSPRRGSRACASGRATSGRATSGRATSGRATSGRATSGRATSGRATSGRARSTRWNSTGVSGHRTSKRRRQLVSVFADRVRSCRWFPVMAGAFDR